MREDHFKKLIGVLIAIVATLIALIALLQADSDGNDARAARDFQNYALGIIGTEVNGQSQFNFNYNKIFDLWLQYDKLADRAEQDSIEFLPRYYRAVRDSLVPLAPLLQPPYFEPETATADSNRFEVDTYITELSSLSERFLAALKVREVWDSKTNTYAIHLTVLAVALFLYGLAVTVTIRFTRILFSVLGTVLTITTVIWALIVWAEPVFDLREVPGAIDAYVLGVGLAYQEKDAEAKAAFDAAIRAAPTYVNAYLARARIHDNLGNLAASAADYEQARALGDSSAQSAWNLAWVYFRLEKFSEAAAMYDRAIEANPNEVWAYYDRGLTYLVLGDFARAQQSYDQGAKLAAALADSALESRSAPPAYLWQALDDASLQLDNYIDTVNGFQDWVVPLSSFINPEQGEEIAVTLSNRIKNLSVALEYTGKPQTDPVEAVISNVRISEPIFEGDKLLPSAPREVFPSDTTAVAVTLDYANMINGQDALLKVYLEGRELPQYRLLIAWNEGAAGTTTFLLSRDSNFERAFESGGYTLEFYVAANFIAMASFVIE
ncbi:MAG: hypothetical protein OHK0023_22940 [Anaerolineae bacterium]